MRIDKKALKVAKHIYMKLDGADVTLTLLNLEKTMETRTENMVRWEHACDVSDYLCDLAGFPGHR